MFIKPANNLNATKISALMFWLPRKTGRGVVTAFWPLDPTSLALLQGLLQQHGLLPLVLNLLLQLPQCLDQLLKGCDLEIKMFIWNGFVDETFGQCDISPMWHFVIVTFCHCDILPMWHFANVTFRQCDISPMWHFVNVTSGHHDNIILVPQFLR